jgi:hypothetical protein
MYGRILLVLDGAPNHSPTPSATIVGGMWCMTVKASRRPRADLDQIARFDRFSPR